MLQISDCVVTLDRHKIREADLVVFTEINSHMENYSMPKFRDPRQVWAYFTIEVTPRMEEALLDRY